MNDLQTLFNESAVSTSGRMSLKLIRIQRLKRFMVLRELEGPVQLGKAIGKSASQASDLLSGLASFGEKVSRSIEEFAGLPANWLDNFQEETNISVGPVLRGTVPLISDIQAGMFKEYVDNNHPGDGEQERIATGVPVNRHTFALRVVNDSMEPEFKEGMVLIVEPELDALPGDYVIAKNGQEETTFKKLVKDGADWYLKPLNPAYPTKPLGNSTIIGVVRAVEKRFR